MNDDAGKVLVALALAAGTLILAASLELARQADRADEATSQAEVAAWQVSQVLDDVRKITAEAALARLRGELAP